MKKMSIQLFATRAKIGGKNPCEYGTPVAQKYLMRKNVFSIRQLLKKINL